MSMARDKVAFMPRFLTAALGALCALAILAPAAPAALQSCPQPNMYELTKVKGVGCKRAETILSRFFDDNTRTPGGFTCKQKQYEGGATTTCRKGEKKIKHFSAD
jgi:Holliday junction resolvasome RuvABC DNA-binding subunit